MEPRVDIEAIITDPAASADVSALLAIAREFSAYPDTIARLVGDPGAAARAMGIVRLACDLCAGAHTTLGCTIGRDALTYLLEHGPTLELESDMLVGVQGALASALTNALHLEGRFEDAVTLVDDLADAAPALAGNGSYWNAVAITVRAWVRQFDLERAKAQIERIPEPFHGVPQYALARTDVDKAVQQRFRVPPPKSLHEKHTDVWHSAVDAQRAMLEAIRVDLARSPPEAAHLADVDTDIGHAIDELEHFSARIDDLHETAVLRDQMLGTLRRFNTLMLRVQNVRSERVDTAGLFAVDRVLERAQWHLELGVVSAADFDDIDRQHHWCSSRGDVHGALMLMWIGALLAAGTGRADEARARFAALLDSLESAIARCPSEDDRGRLANYFYDLPAKVFDQFALRDPGEVFRAAELRKGRTLLSMRASPTPAGERAQAALLGARTHYLAITVLEDTARVLLTFYGASGRVDTAEAMMSPAAIRRAATRLAPDRWRERELFGPPSAALPETLRPLLAPLEAALERGDVLEGDHVCIAADDPVSLMPLQIARLGSGRTVDHVSLSRVTSFRDAAAIARSPIVRPDSALLASVPVDERNGEAKAAAVTRIASCLERLGMTPTRLDGPIAHEALLRAAGQHSLIHIDAHGFFPSEPDGAFERAGLLVPQTRDARSRRAAPDRILSSGAIERTTLDLTGAHVTLNACVSGVGLPGYGGDILGLELALRLKGAASVLATHWDVRWPLSAVFLERFYRRWLGGGRSRAAAWRQAMLESMTDAQVAVSRAEEWGAFSLYGDWR